MTWFKTDDSFAFHPKAIAAGNAALGLWVRAGSWSLQQLTDGAIPAHVIQSLGSKAHAKALVAAQLWHEPGHRCDRCPDIDGGYLFHDWLDYQPSADEIRAERAAKHEAKAKAGKVGGIASGVARRKHSRSRPEADGKQTGSEAEAKPKQNEAPTRPDPTRSPSSVGIQPSPPLPGVEDSTSEKLRMALEAFYRRPVTLADAKRTGQLVTAGIANVGNPVRYVMAAVAKDPDRYRPPKPFERERPPMLPPRQMTQVEVEARDEAARAARDALRSVTT